MILLRKNALKWNLSVLLIKIVILTSVLSLTSAIDTKAYCAYLNKLGVPIGVDEEPFSIKTQYAGLGEKTAYVEISNIHHRRIKDDMDKVTFTIEYRDYTLLSREDRNTIVQSDYYKKYHTVGDDWFIAVVDGKTGLSYKKNNSQGVVFKIDDSNTTSGFGMHWADNGESFTIDNRWKRKIIITYPIKSDRVYLAIGGSNVLKNNETKADKGFL